MVEKNFEACFSIDFSKINFVNNKDFCRAALPFQGLSNDIFCYLATIEFFEIRALKGNFGVKIRILQKKGQTSLLQIFLFLLPPLTN